MMNVSSPNQANGHTNGTTNGTSNGVTNGVTSVPTSGLRYGMFSDWKSSSKKKDLRSEAVDIIGKSLPKMTKVKAVLELDLGLDNGPIYIDTREQPRILQTFESEPDCRVKIKPQYIKSFHEGQLEPRYGLFKDGFFDETSLPKGDIKVAVKFADALCPSDPTHPVSPKPGARLPVPTEDIDQVRADMKEFGYGLVANALTKDQVGMLREALAQQGRGEVSAGVAANDGGPSAPNQRIWTLINKGQEFLDLLEHPLIDEVIPENLGEYFLIHSYSANIARPGNTPMMLHTDQVGIQPPQRNVFYGINIMWFLEDVTRENGGTRVFPGSHMGNIAPDDPFNIDGTVAAEGPAGTALVFESRLWHATGPNTMRSGERPVILMFFMRSYIRQQENNFLSIRPEVEATLSDKVRRMLGKSSQLLLNFLQWEILWFITILCTTLLMHLGFVTDGAFGGVEGEVREGRYVKKLANPVGPFRDTHQHAPFRQDIRAQRAGGARTTEPSGNE